MYLLVTGGIDVSEYSRRNRGNSSDFHDDFDWEKFDRRTASSSTVYRDGDVPRRRRTAATEDARRKKQVEYRKEERKPLRQETRTTQQNSTPKRRKTKKKLSPAQIEKRQQIRKAVLIALLVIFVMGSGLFVGMYAAVSREIKEMNIESLALNYTSTIYYYDEDGDEREYGKLRSDNNRIWVDSEDIAPCFKDAIVSIEDERFYKHNGVDLKRTVGATVKYVLAKMGIGESNYGGSTITQQVIKNITSEDDFKATRKIKEIMRAIALENQLSKDEILTMYCNVAFFANGCYGVEAASRTYFNKSAIDLNIEEAAAIAGITQYPSLYDPIANPENNIEKRNIVLGKMYELEKITESEYQETVNSPLSLSRDYIRKNAEITSYFEDQLVNDVINDLVKQKNYTEEFAESQVYNGGFKIYATIDPKIQSAMEDVLENPANFSSGGSKKLQAGMVVSDPYTGEIKGIVGGLGEKTDIRGWNRATQMVRPPGSSIKPIAVYAPAVDLGKITSSDIVKDEEITIDKWTPKNSYTGFKGDMTVKEAVARSANIPAVKVIEKVGVSNSYGYLQNKFHITTLSDKDKNYASLALGGLTNGVSVKEMAAAYGVFVNSGKYITPYTYTRVLDASGQVILENRKSESQAISRSAAYIMADMLWGPVNLSMGTAGRAKLSSGMPTYGKTGTTDDNYDKWFVGFTPYYVGAVWFGYDTPSSLASGNPCVSAWNMVFEKIMRDYSYKELDKPSSLVEERICIVTGKLANRGCSSVKSYFVSGTEPEGHCTGHYVAPVEDEDEDDDEESTDSPSSTSKPDSTGSPSSTSKPSSNGGTSGGTIPDNNTGGNSQIGEHEPSGDIAAE